MSLGEMIEMEATTDEEDCHRDSSSPQSPSQAAVISKEREGSIIKKKTGLNSVFLHFNLERPVGCKKMKNEFSGPTCVCYYRVQINHERR